MMVTVILYVSYGHYGAGMGTIPVWEVRIVGTHIVSSHPVGEVSLYGNAPYMASCPAEERVHPESAAACK